VERLVEHPEGDADLGRAGAILKSHKLVVARTVIEEDLGSKKTRIATPSSSS
jgi:hypothetical protein